MEIYISNTGERPIYAQIADQIRAKILSGELREGDALPSIRLLARELRISVITTKRAYEDLERDGFVRSVPGKGSYVAPQNAELHREAARKDVEALLLRALEAARAGGVPDREVAETLALLMEGEPSGISDRSPGTL